MRKTITVLALLIATIVATVSLTACGGTASAEPTNLDGTWVSTSDSTGFVAEVRQGTIEINLTASGDKSLYWAGTFQSTAKDGDKITSAANVEQLKASMTGSQDSSKEFTYSDGKISFKMSMMGTTKTIELEKNSASTN